MCTEVPSTALPVSIEQLKARYLVGVNLTVNGCEPYPDETFDFAIRSAVAETEDALDINILPREYTWGDDINNLERLNLLETAQDEFGRYGAERHDWYPYNPFSHMKLKKRPLIGRPTRVCFYYMGAAPVVVFPGDWLSVKDGNTVTLDMVAAVNSPTNLVLGPLNTTQLLYTRALPIQIPNLLLVEYKAGFEPGCVPRDIQDAVGLNAAIQIFNIAGDLIAGAGIASYSVGLGGLSQSISTTSSATNAGYGARIIQYEKKLKALLATLRKKYHGYGLAVV